jgi:thiosulfate/3-mercaptopyruvate sulfurtransferase
VKAGAGMRYLRDVKLLFLAVVVTLAALLAAEIPTIEPKEMAELLAGSGAKPPIIYVGPSVLYRSRHIPGAIEVGMTSKPESLEALRAAAGKLPRDRELFLYCGCCPWDRCPNVKPAVSLLQEMGFKRVKTVYLPQNFKSDWIDRGYPAVQ